MMAAMHCYEGTVNAEAALAQVRAALERLVQDGITVYSAGVAEDWQPGRQRRDI